MQFKTWLLPRAALAAADVIAPGGGAPPAPPAPPSGGTPPPPPAPPSGGAFQWDPALPSTHVDLLKAKGMYDDPVKGASMLVNSYYEANKALSGAQDVAIVPADWSNTEAVDKFLGKTRGVVKPEEYEIKVPDGVPVHQPLLDFGKKLAHMWGVPKALVQKGFDEWQKFGQEQAQWFATEQAKANDAAVTALKTKHGEAVFTQHVANAQNVFKALSARGAVSKETLDAVEKNIGSAALLELMFAIGQGFKEAPALGVGAGAPPTDPLQMTPEQAQAEINRLQGDADFNKKYLDAKHPEHDASVKRMNLLFEAVVRRQPGR